MQRYRMISHGPWSGMFAEIAVLRYRPGKAAMAGLNPMQQLRFSPRFWQTDSALADDE